jgi:hypothetical protein
VPAVALVNQALFDLLWPDVDPLGRTVRASGGEYTVIGVVHDARQLSVEEVPAPRCSSRSASSAITAPCT